MLSLLNQVKVHVPGIVNLDYSIGSVFRRDVISLFLVILENYQNWIMSLHVRNGSPFVALDPVLIIPSLVVLDLNVDRIIQG